MPPRRAARSSAASTRLFKPMGDQVCVRMYGQGLGDCFLLAIPRSSANKEQPVYVLIDCGVIGGSPGGPETMRNIVKDIKQSTGGHLDLLIITHEHWDHLSSFVQADSEWNEITVDNLWMAWTERTDSSGFPDPLKKILEKQQRTLAQVADHARRFGLEEQHSTVASLLAFLSDPPADGMGFAAAPGVRDAFIAAKAKVQNASSRVCCEPGEVRRVPGTDVAAYVLGPPLSAAISKINPSKKTPETFEDEHEPTPAASGARSGVADARIALERMATGPSAFNAFAMPLLAASLSLDEDETDSTTLSNPREFAIEQDVYDRSFPFDRLARIPLHIAELDVADAPESFPALASYFNAVNHWRRIDFDWLAEAEAFALRAEHLTNNTSLVLAFELPQKAGDTNPANRKVLLFPGDAQVGNWLSWDDISEWKVIGSAGPSQSKPNIGDLLARTVFYKAGHHGSHNATLKAKGVERMRSDKGELAAFVPVSVPVAHKVKKWERMPMISMVNALSERASGQVVFPDGSIGPIQPDQPRELLGASHKPRFKVSTTMLDAKDASDGSQLEAQVPLWVEVAIDF